MTSKTTLLTSFLLAGCLTARPPTTETIDRTPDRVARGRYLVEHVAECLPCHSPRDWTKPYGPVMPGLVGSGGAPLGADVGVPGVAVPGNLTPDPTTGLGQVSDGAVLRALREGVGHDERALFPVMPYVNYRTMSDDDARAVVAYLRTLPPVEHQTAPTRINFPVSLFIRGVPKPVDPVAPPPPDPISQGRYLVTLAGCRECHSQLDKRGKVIAETAFGGGRTFQGEGFTCVSAPLDGRAGSFMASATKEAFIARFRVESAPPGANSVMPWPALRGLTDEDLTAIYAYLTSEVRR